jgi:hypothetical protein
LCAALPARAGELRKSVALSVEQVEVSISYPGDERKRWAESVMQTIEAGLAPLEKAAGFVSPVKSIEVFYADGPGASGGFEAQWKGEGRVAVRQKGARGGYHGHWVLFALAHAWSERVAAEPWAREALAHFYVWKALRDAPQIYDSRTYRDELIQEAARADETPLDGWQPPSAEADGAGGERPAALAQPARGMLFLCCVERRIGEGAIARASHAVSATGPGGTAALAAAIGQGGKPAEDLFLGWAVKVTDPAKQHPALRTQDIGDGDDDSLLDFEERELGTDPNRNDTDQDGALDGEEVFDTHTDPRAKDAPAAPVKLDGETNEWMRLRKFSLQDRKGDTRDASVKGGDLLRVQLCADARYLYLALETDSLENAQVKYGFEIDANGDGVGDYIFGFRGDRQRWIGDTHGVKDLSWCEWKNHRGIVIRTKDAVAEMRVPLSAIGKPEKFELLVYSETRAGMLDTCLRASVDLEKWRN